ncbi:MAG: pilus assembly protein PilM, partial [bacterium]|nr:pilus assembly protein PilM [bacterium]
SINVERAVPFTNRDKIDKIYLSGGGSNAPGIIEYFKERFDVEVEKMNPFKNVKIKEGLFAIDEIEKMSPLLVPSIGLSLRS